MKEFEEFTRLLWDRHGIEPMDVGIDDLGDYLAAAGDDSPGEMVSRFARRYGFLTLAEMNT